MGLNFAEKAIFLPKQIDFPKIKYKNVEHFNLVHAQKPIVFLQLPVPNFFYCPFPFVFLGPFTLVTFCLSYSFWLP